MGKNSINYQENNFTNQITLYITTYFIMKSVKSVHT